MSIKLDKEPAALKFTANSKNIELRLANNEYEVNKVAELWANLVMLLQLKGERVWLDEQEKSGLDWFPFVHSLFKNQEVNYIVFEDIDQKNIFGFAYFVVQPCKQESPNASGKKAVLKELYLEPSHRSEKLNAKAVASLREFVYSTGVDDIELNYKDLS